MSVPNAKTGMKREAKGKFDGSVQGKEYFKCTENHRTFVDQSQIAIHHNAPTSPLLTHSSIGGDTSIPLPSSMRREKVDTALGEEETVEILGDENLSPEEVIDILRETEVERKAHMDLNKELEENHLQTEHDPSELLEMIINELHEVELKLKTTQEACREQNAKRKAKLQEALMDLNKRHEENHRQTEHYFQAAQESIGDLEAKLQLDDSVAMDPLKKAIHYYTAMTQFHWPCESLYVGLKIFTAGTECATKEIERLKRYSKDCDKGSAFGELVQEVELRNVKIQQLCRKIKRRISEDQTSTLSFSDKIQESLMDYTWQQSLVLEFFRELTAAVTEEASSLTDDENLLSGQLDELANDVAVLVFETDEVPCKDIVSHTLDEVISFLSSFVTKIQEDDHDAEPKEESKVMAAADTSDKKIAQALENQGGTQKRQRKDEVENETAAKAKRRRSDSNTVALLQEEKNLAQKWKMKKMQPQKQRLQAENYKMEQSKRQHQDLLQVVLQQTKQQHEQMQNFQRMFTSMCEQQSHIILKLLEK